MTSALAALILMTASVVPDLATRAPRSSGHGVAFWILGAVLVIALGISIWRLRRRTSGPEA